MERKLQDIVKKIEGLQGSLQKETDFFKKKFLTDEIKKLTNEKSSLDNKIAKLKELTGEMKTASPKNENKKETTPAAAVADKDLINGPCHEVIKTAGGKGTSEVHYYATEIAGENQVKLDYLSPKGKSTGLLAKTVSKDDYLKKIISCIEHGCNIVK